MFLFCQQFPLTGPLRLCKMCHYNPEVNNNLLAFEHSLENSPDEPAKPMLTFMVKGLFIDHKFPYEQ